MNKYSKLIFGSIMSFAIAVALFLLPNCMAKSKEIGEFSYINVWDENTHYWGYGIMLENGILCDGVRIYLEEPLIESIPIHIFYSNGAGLSEEKSLWFSLKSGETVVYIDIPNGKYSELRLDIDGECSISKVIIEEYNKHEKAYYILGMLFGIISVIFGVKFIMAYPKARTWMGGNIKAIIIFVITAIICFSYSANIWYEIEDMTTSSYHLETDYHTQEIDYGNKYYFNMDIHDSNLVLFEFWADILGESAELRWSLLQDGTCILSGQLNNDNYNEGIYNVQLNPDILGSAGMYQLELEPLNMTSIQVYVDENNYLKTTYHYLFDDGNVIKTILIIINIFIMVIVILLLSKLNIYIKYWIMAVSLGMLSIIIVIPLSTADEFRHFARAYSVASGQFVCNYDEEGSPYADIPENLYNLRYIAPESSTSIADETNMTANFSRWIYYLKSNDTDEKISAWLGGVSSKGIFEYLPQVIMIWIGMLLGLKQVWLFYLARIGNWLAITLIWYAIIRIVPRHKMLFIVLYCMPTNIVYACTSSTDGLLNALVMLVMAIAIRRYYDNIPLTDKRILFSIVAVCAYIAILKIPYILVALSLVALDDSIGSFKENWKKIVKNIFIVIGGCIVSYLLAAFLKGFYQPDVGISDNSNIEHIRYALDHVLEVGHIFIQAFMDIADGTYRQAIAINSFNISILVIPYSLLMLYSGTIEENKKVVNSLQTVIITMICLLIWGCVLLAAYFWTNIGNMYIWGIQGRYICPIIMIGTATLALRLQNRNKIKEERYVTAYCMAIMMVAFLKIMQIQWV